MRRWIGAAAVLLAAAGCVSGNETATMTVTPAAALYDEPVTVRMTGLGAGRETTVTARTTDGAGVTWTSSATFRAGRDGTLDLGGAPTAGSYQDANPMGLFQFMTPDKGGPYLTFPADGGYQVALEAAVDGRTVARATATRQAVTRAQVMATTLTPAKDGLSGVLFLPKDTSARGAAAVVFGGSEGGLSGPVQLRASLLAAHGHPALALAYWKAPGLPQKLVGIPLEYFRRAVEKLRAAPGVDPAKVFVDGTSWGGEAALLLGATYPELIHGVIAEVPNSYVDVSFDDGTRSSWSLGGKDLPAADRSHFNSPASDVDRRAWIDVARIRGPLLMTCGGLDQDWNSCRNVDDVLARLPDPKAATVLRYRDGGHYVGALPPYLPYTDSTLSQTGGKLAPTLAANVEVLKRVLDVLSR